MQRAERIEEEKTLSLADALAQLCFQETPHIALSALTNAYANTLKNLGCYNARMSAIKYLEHSIGEMKALVENDEEYKKGECDHE